MYRNFIVNLGYCEHQSLACLIMEHKVGFSSNLEAKRSIRDVLIAHLTEHSTSKSKKCCKQTAQDFSSAKFCMSCGSTLLPNISGFQQADLLEDVFRMDIDEASGNRIWDAFEAVGWNLTAQPNNPQYLEDMSRWLTDGEDDNEYEDK